MGEPDRSPKITQKQSIICCPVCGQDLVELPLEQIEKCPNCAFNLALVQSPHESPTKPPIQVVVPRFAYLLLVIQAIVAAIIGLLFLFFASPYYFGMHLIFALIQFPSVLIIALFLIVLRFPNIAFIARIGLIIFSIVTLPLGLFAFTAAFSISAPRQQPIKQHNSGGTNGG
ncbi:MAG: hypothetical protein Q6364_13680 [Candidatus Hermodarchaeota archaeon]|nr:hypothetical protein [Candidatus Hermodarchaeota archaeon]